MSCLKTDSYYFRPLQLDRLMAELERVRTEIDEIYEKGGSAENE